MSHRVLSIDPKLMTVQVTLVDAMSAQHYYVVADCGSHIPHRGGTFFCFV